MEAFSQPASKCYTYDPEMSVYRVQLVSSVIEIEVIIGFFSGNTGKQRFLSATDVFLQDAAGNIQ